MFRFYVSSDSSVLDMIGTQEGVMYETGNHMTLTSLYLFVPYSD